MRHMTHYTSVITKRPGDSWTRRYHWSVFTKNSHKAGNPIRQGWAFTEGMARKACNHAIKTHSREA